MRTTQPDKLEHGGSHLHCVQALDPLWGGGLATAALGLHDGMLRLGVTSSVLSTCGRGEHAANRGVYQFERVGPTKAFFSPPLWNNAARFVESTSLVHLHGFYAATNFAVGRAARALGRSIVCHPHGMFEPYILSRSRFKKRVARWLFEDANTRAASVWRALTPVEADQVRVLVPGARIVVIPNGVDVPSHSSTLTDSPRRIGYLGRLHEKKGLELLLQAWAAIQHECPDWELVIAGPGSSDYGARLREAAVGVPRTSVHGPLVGSAKQAFLHSLSLFVLPSYSEGFPMAVLEAMASGAPVVVTRTSNAPAVDALGAGWTCEPEAESLRRTLRLAVQCSAGELSARGLAGRDLVLRDYTWPRVTALLVDACRAA